VPGNVCQGYSCLNGGTCYISNENKAMCQCERGYIGLNCEQDICKQKMNEGTCSNVSTRYYYDPDLKACRTFTYRGCNGNENNFEDFLSCSKQCSGH